MQGAHSDFGSFVRAAHRAGRLVVQPRMGFSDPAQMRRGLAATKGADATTVGTLTIDAYTRVGDTAAVDEALRRGTGINGFPIVNYGAHTTRDMLDGIHGPDFPVQVRHGSAKPFDIFAATVRAGLSASEGGPVSYCLPYGRTPLDQSVREWDRSTLFLAQLRGMGVDPHLETFGGCMLGQLCPPSLLVAISALEALFFYRHGIRSISVSYAQQTHFGQDIEAVAALRALCAELLPAATWHVVIYTYMGVYPTTDGGSYRLLGQAAQLAAATGSERIIVKTVAESRRIPTIEENIEALEHATRAATAFPGGARPGNSTDSQVYAEAHALVAAVLDLHDDVGQALILAFKRGLLDVPYCVHPDNMGRTRSYIDDTGRLRWATTGELPIGHLVESSGNRRVTSGELLGALSYVSHKFDTEAMEKPLPTKGSTSLR
ncbi:methylaspartate mutase [Streptomyces sp. NBC_01439]|uniref:methylaspartate mutase n=1 Tax=Streptomyces sp. NBC_01439 TaxID=2903867 RepID=UPI002E353FDC|nr:methylaspartate mutase [Streptomyces sp. NBC_01439]